MTCTHRQCCSLPRRICWAASSFCLVGRFFEPFQIPRHYWELEIILIVLNASFLLLLLVVKTYVITGSTVSVLITVLCSTMTSLVETIFEIICERNKIKLMSRKASVSVCVCVLMCYEAKIWNGNKCKLSKIFFMIGLRLWLVNVIFWGNK